MDVREIAVRGDPIWVTIPPQAGKETPSTAVHKELKGHHGYPTGSNGVKAGRILMNVVIHEEGDPLAILKTFDPPVKLKAKYNQHDVARAGGAECLRLAWWSENDRQWNPLETEVDPEEQEGWADLREWDGDPPVAWTP